MKNKLDTQLQLHLSVFMYYLFRKNPPLRIILRVQSWTLNNLKGLIWTCMPIFVFSWQNFHSFQFHCLSWKFLFEISTLSLKVKLSPKSGWLYTKWLNPISTTTLISVSYSKNFLLDVVYISSCTSIEWQFTITDGCKQMV